MDTNAIALAIAGAAQPWIQEFIIRNKLTKKLAHSLTVAFSFVAAGVATWVTGGFAGSAAFDLVDPSGFFASLATKTAPVYAVSQIVYGYFRNPIHRAAGTPLRAI